MRVLCALVGVLVLSACSKSNLREELPLVQKHEASPIAMLEKLKHNPQAKFIYQDGWTIVLLGTSMWSFTPEDHPDHPSAVKRTVVSANGNLEFKSKSYCPSAAETCDHLVAEVERLSSKLPKQAISQR